MTQKRRTIIDVTRDKFKIIRENALANPYVYNCRYCQIDEKDAYIEYLENRLEQMTIAYREKGI